MSNKGGVPDAWDDDWETLADKPDSQPSAEPQPKLTKAQRRVQHQEQQKQLWDSAENPDRMQWLEAKGVVPLKQEFKPQVKLLSRNPTPSIAKRNPADGLANLSLEEDDSDEESRKKQEADLEERQRKAKLEREEKQRRYAEARERIMGSSSSTTTAAPAAMSSRESSHSRDSRRGRGGKIIANRNSTGNSQATSSADQSPSRPVVNGEKQLFDPDDMGRRLPMRESPAPAREDQPSRQPRGPESGGRGGFGFAQRGGRVGP